MSTAFGRSLHGGRDAVQQDRDGFLSSSRAACSSTTTVTTTDGGTTTDARVKDTGTKDTGTIADSGTGTCKPQDVSSFAPAADPGPATAAGACTDQDATRLLHQLHRSGRHHQVHRHDRATPRRTRASRASTRRTRPPSGARSSRTAQGLIRNNIAGCLTVKGDSACATAVSDSNQCTAAACPDTVCPVPDGDTAALDALNKCESDAEKAGCKTYADKTVASTRPTAEPQRLPPARAREQHRRLQGHVPRGRARPLRRR